MEAYRRATVRPPQKLSASMGDLKHAFLEGVEGKLRNLQLSEAEKKGIRIGRKQACSSQVSKLQAVGKLFSERLARAEHVGKSLGAAWSPFFGVECSNLGRNRFLFTFHQKADKEKALDAGPWSFNNDLLVMEDFVPSKTIDDYEFRTIPIWARAYGIPIGMMSRETAELVGEQIGEFIEADPDVNGDSMGVFMRIKVRIDITVPIMRFITSVIEEEEQEQGNEMILGRDDGDINESKKEEKIISFTYEYLPDFCYSCGIIGHTEKSCPTRSRRTGARQFGPWLRAIMHKGSSSEERSKSPNDKGRFWPSNSAGSKGSKQGSDGPSWRRDEPSRDENKRLGIGEEKEVIGPLKLKHEEDQKLTEGRKLDYSTAGIPGEFLSEKKQIPEAEGSKTEHNDNITTKTNQGSEGPKIDMPTEEKEGAKKEEESKVQKPRKDTKQGTFKRFEKRGNRQYYSLVTEAKKRKGDIMDVDDELELAKKAKMEVDGDAEKEECTNSEYGNAGLQGQPGESK